MKYGTKLFKGLSYWLLFTLETPSSATIRRLQYIVRNISSFGTSQPFVLRGL